MDALSILATRLEDSDEVQQRAKEVTILTVNELSPGTIVLGQARRCATPGCPILFVRTHPHQKYHSKSCAELSKSLRQTKIRKNFNPKLVTSSTI
ncbi:MAG: hypothetical protein DPW09_26150 [Anaerolineae bacterium]|nr:hypothetical protein [Anaerolineae bacterium]MCQ3976926.1 hypothetical protein [Anaerolineae bacterium]